MNKRKILIGIGIISSIPILTFCTVLTFYTIDNYLEHHYCKKGGGLEYEDSMFNTCVYLIVDENGTKALMIPNSSRNLRDNLSTGDENGTKALMIPKGHTLGLTETSQLVRGTICESDDLECLNNTSPSISIDGISITESIPFVLPILLILFVVCIIIWKYKKRDEDNPK